MNLNELYEFIQSRKLAVMASVHPSTSPQSALVGIAVTQSLELIFDTLKSSRKYRNLTHNPNIAFVIGWEDEKTIQYEGTAIKHINTGELVLGLNDSLYWSRTRMVSDGKTQKLEDRLDKFFLTVIDIANKEKAERLERERFHHEEELKRMKKAEIEEKKRQIKENREHKFQAELSRRVELEKSAQSYISAKQIYQFVEAVEAELRVVNLNDIQKRHFNEWKGWAMEHANRLNPVKLKINSIINAEMETSR